MSMHPKLPRSFLESDPLRHDSLIGKQFSALLVCQSKRGKKYSTTGKFDMVEWNEDGTARYRFVRKITSNSIEQILESTSRRQRMNWYVVRQSSDGNLFAYGDFDPWQPESACRFEDTIVFRSIEGESKHDSFEENDEAWDSFHHQLKNGDEANIITYVDADGIWKALYHTVYSGTPHESVLGVCKQCMRATVDIHEMKGKKAEVLPEGVFRPRLSVTIEIEHFGLYHSISADQPFCTQCRPCTEVFYDLPRELQVHERDYTKKIQDNLLLHAVHDAPWSAVGASLQIHKRMSEACTYYICRIVRWIPPEATGSHGMAPLFLVKFADGGTEEYRFNCFEDSRPAPSRMNYAYTKYQRHGISALRVLSFPGMKKSATIHFWECGDYETVDLGNRGGHLQIILAIYSSSRTTHSGDNDCTSSTQELVTNGRIKVEGGIHTKIGDPEPGRPKKFRVWYTHETKAQRQARNEENARPVLLRFYYRWHEAYYAPGGTFETLATQRFSTMAVSLESVSGEKKEE